MAVESAGPASALVRTERRGHVLVIRMCRAHKRNAVDRALADALDEAFNTLDDDPDLRAGVLTGSDGVFSAGSDLTANGDYVTERGGAYGLIRRRRTTPLIAAVEGPALGGGLELVLACDLVVASATAVFGLPEVSRGLVATCAGLFRGPRALPVNLARELALTGDPFDAERAHAAGLVNRLTAEGAALDTAVALATRIAENAPVAVRASLTAMDRWLTAEDALGWRATAEAVATVEASDDLAEGISAFLEKRAPVWKGR
ncbi:Carnitinyl-CoA dehydratase [Streptomyces sp. YIM 130001]|uniref:enoyl-CoA hydratase-related protein n=1 Tax=Streptomyces sp. YIM 130001 TaxID=2259644 RepID=UPI000EEADCF5|nr:enoyl-CoA hydratase-related protein [Streptomyces sp. YIM 130001]RII09690.1 Carnitinyl-CoA dehydratase [Streptomyces sp. YIM 130001]